MNSYEREIQNLLPVLNNLERNLLGRSFSEQTGPERPSYSQHAGPSGHFPTNLTANGHLQMQNIFSTDEVKSIDERLSFLEEKLQHYRRGQEHDSISQRRNQTLPAQSLNTITQNRNRKNSFKDTIRASKVGATFPRSSTLYCPMRNSNEMTIEKTHPTLILNREELFIFILLSNTTLDLFLVMVNLVTYQKA